MKRLLLMVFSVLVLAGCSGSDGELSGSYEVSKNDSNDPQAIFTFEENQVIVDAMSEDESLQLRETYEILEEDREDGLVLLKFNRADFHNTGLNTSEDQWLFDSEEMTLVDTAFENGEHISTENAEGNYKVTKLYLEKR